MVDGLKKQLEEGVPASSMTGTAQKKAVQYLSIRRKKGSSGISVSYNTEACRYHGYSALVSNHAKDRFEAKKKYRPTIHLHVFCSVSALQEELRAATNKLDHT